MVSTDVLGVLVGVFVLSVMATIALGAVLLRHRYSTWFRQRISHGPVPAFGRADAARNASPGNMLLVGVVGLVIVGMIGSRVLPALWIYPSVYAGLGTIAAVVGPAAMCVGLFHMIRGRTDRTPAVHWLTGGALIVGGVVLVSAAVVIFS